MENQTGRFIPPWLWALLAAGVICLTILLALTDRRQPPAKAYQYDISQYAESKIPVPLYTETKRIALEMNQPNALAIAPDGTIWVAGENRLAAYTPEGAPVKQFTISGTPECMAFAGDARLFLGLRDRIMILDAGGNKIAEWPIPGEKPYCTSLAVSDTSVYIADAGGRIIWRMDPSGNVQNKIGERIPDRKNTGLIVPSPHLDVARTPSGELWTTNPGRHGIEYYRDNGEMVTSWYRPGMGWDGFCGCCNPVHIAFLSNGSIVTAEKGLTRVKVYSPDTSLSAVVAGPAQFEAAGRVPEDTSAIKDLAVDGRDRVWVLYGPGNLLLLYTPPAAENPRDGKAP